MRALILIVPVIIIIIIAMALLGARPAKAARDEVRALRVTLDTTRGDLAVAEAALRQIARINTNSPLAASEAQTHADLALTDIENARTRPRERPSGAGAHKRSAPRL